jgi:protein-L-isoaspartate(D-aspartate) O-methyltransferase
MTAFDTERARHNMIEQQIRPWEVIDPRVLDVLPAVPREAFVPGGYRGLAFADIEIPIGHGEVMLAPKIEAKLLQALAIQPTDRVL